MPADITNDFAAALRAEGQILFYLVSLQFDSGDLNLFTGTGTVEYNAKTFTGAGPLLDIQLPSEENTNSAKPCELSLSGMDKGIVDLVRSENYMYRKGVVYMGLATDEDFQTLIGVRRLFSGQINNIIVQDDGDTVSVNCTITKGNYLANFETKLYSENEQRKLYPNDAGCDLIPYLANTDINWNGMILTAADLTSAPPSTGNTNYGNTPHTRNSVGTVNKTPVNQRGRFGRG